MSDKIINTFQQRRQVAIAVADLAQIRDQRALIAAAQEIHDAYPDSMIQAEILKRLDTPDSQLRGGLGHLAALLPRAEISPALRSIAADRSQTAQSRLTAALLLSQFVGDPAPPALLSDLGQTNEVAYQSLLEAVEEGKSNRHILLEYTLQMRHAGDEIAPMILDLLDRLPEADRVELLRMIALDDRNFVAGDALARLESLAATPTGADALRALHVLQFLVPPDRAPSVERALRKLRFGGDVYRPPEPVGWRALMSIADLTGRQAVWFVRMPSERESAGAILYMSVNNYTGQIQALADEAAPARELPPERAIGQLVSMESDTGRDVAFVEAPFDFARWRVLQALPGQWALASELPPEFRLYSDLIWEFARPEAAPDLRHYFGNASGNDGLAESPAAPSDVHSVAAALMEQPAMRTWLSQNQGMVSLLPGSSDRRSPQEQAALATAALAQLERREEGRQLTAAMAAGLRAQAAWFHISGSQEAANLALQLARTLPDLPISQNPLLLALVETELRDQRAGTEDA